MTGNAKIVRHHYKVVNELKQYTVFELTASENGKVLTDLIRIENDRHFHRGDGFLQWLRVRNTNNWSKCKLITGLFLSSQKSIYYGDMIYSSCKNLLIFKYSNDGKQLQIDFYPRFCPSKPKIEEIIKNSI
ncbi:MAG TPA: hypothetical protein PLL66_01605 [Bacteroidales bacterium]|nr:hypothetical protein [Bacteroidales bacterium]